MIVIPTPRPCAGSCRGQESSLSCCESLYSINPNSVLSDLVSLLDHNQEDALRCYSAAESAEQLGIVLIARNALMIAQASSPALMPAWVPRWADTLLSVTLRDITWTADAPLNSPEARIGNLRERLFTLEGELLERLQAVHAAEHGRSNALMELLRRSPDERLTSFIDAFNSSDGGSPTRRVTGPADGTVPPSWPGYGTWCRLSTLRRSAAPAGP